MNKLDVALKLFRLLNERKSIDSRTVAGDLQVSLRTAQRYLLDLSALPCVITDEKKHSYSLDPDYPLKDTLFRQTGSKQPTQKMPKEIQGASGPNYVFCLTCGQTRNCFPELSLVLKSSEVTRDARHEFNRLVSLIKRKLKEGKCSFP